MQDCYDTRFFTQSMIDAIIEIWDSAASDGEQVAAIDSGDHKDTANVLVAFKPREQGTTPFGQAKGEFLPYLTSVSSSKLSA